jgi:hypothetical protein
MTAGYGDAGCGLLRRVWFVDGGGNMHKIIKLILSINMIILVINCENDEVMKIKKEFYIYLKEWHKYMNESGEAIFSSKSSVLINCEAYKKIISLGDKVIPYIIEEINKGEFLLIYALEEITKYKPYDPDEISMYEQYKAKKWLEWWEQNKYKYNNKSTE